MKILGIDYGEKRIGFALGDSKNRLALPLQQVRNTGKHSLLDIILQLMSEYEVGLIVFGYPLNMDGSESRASRTVAALIRFLKGKLEIPIDMAEERLSSWEAEETLKSRFFDFRKRKHHLDSMSAKLILENYFEKKQKNI